MTRLNPLLHDPTNLPFLLHEQFHSVTHVVILQLVVVVHVPWHATKITHSLLPKVRYVRHRPYLSDFSFVVLTMHCSLVPVGKGISG